MPPTNANYAIPASAKERVATYRARSDAAGLARIEALVPGELKATACSIAQQEGASLQDTVAALLHLGTLAYAQANASLLTHAMPPVVPPAVAEAVNPVTTFFQQRKTALAAAPAPSTRKENHHV